MRRQGHSLPLRSCKCATAALSLEVLKLFVIAVSATSSRNDSSELVFTATHLKWAECTYNKRQMPLGDSFFIDLPNTYISNFLTLTLNVLTK